MKPSKPLGKIPQKHKKLLAGLDALTNLQMFEFILLHVGDSVLQLGPILDGQHNIGSNHIIIYDQMQFPLILNIQIFHNIYQGRISFRISNFLIYNAIKP